MLKFSSDPFRIGIFRATRIPCILFIPLLSLLMVLARTTSIKECRISLELSTEQVSGLLSSTTGRTVALELTLISAL